MDTELIKALLPVVLIQLAFQVVALIHLVKHKKTRNLSVWMWAAIIVIGELLGVVAYFVFGREED